MKIFNVTGSLEAYVSTRTRENITSINVASINKTYTYPRPIQVLYESGLYTSPKTYVIGYDSSPIKILSKDGMSGGTMYTLNVYAELSDNNKTLRIYNSGSWYESVYNKNLYVYY